MAAEHTTIAALARKATSQRKPKAGVVGDPRALKELQRATPQTANKAGSNQHSSPATVAADRTPYRKAIDANGISERSARRYQQLADVPQATFEEALRAPESSNALQGGLNASGATRPSPAA